MGTLTKIEQRLLECESEGKVLLLDGGLGTTLREAVEGDTYSALWSAAMVREAPTVLGDVHLAFAKAGAGVISTATFQATLDGFMREYGIDRARAVALLHSAVGIARHACDMTASVSDGTSSQNPLIALSLGPFGSTLGSSQEYTGRYPCPLGPASEADDLTSPSFPDDEAGNIAEALAERQLTDWHADRLSLFTTDTATAQTIDVIAFETVALSREIRAVRAAIDRVERESGRRWPFWVSSVLPAGRVVEPAASVADLVSAQLSTRPPHGLEGISYARPLGFAVNCTPTHRLLPILERTAEALGAMGVSDMPLLIYPNREFEDAPETRDEDVWVDTMVGMVRWARLQVCFGAIAVGGCCGTTPECIARLRKRL